jgi:hypothetical protein
MWLIVRQWVYFMKSRCVICEGEYHQFYLVQYSMSPLHASQDCKFAMDTEDILPSTVQSSSKISIAQSKQVTNIKLLSVGNISKDQYIAQRARGAYIA